MKESIKQGKGKEYNSFKTEDKHYFGGFFNLADNNIEEALKEVGQRLNTTLDSKKLIDKYTKETISLVDYERFIHLLTDYFPIVNEIDQINKKDDKGNIISNTKIERLENFKETFLLLINSIDELRNYYTHYHHDPIQLEPKLFAFLDDVLLKTVLDTKKNYLKMDKTKEMMKDSLKEDYKKIFDLKVQDYLSKDNLTSKKIKKARKYGNGFDDKLTNEIEHSIYNDTIKDFIYDKSKKAELTHARKTSFNDKDPFVKNKDFDLPISSNGIIFLLSLFLNRKEIENLKANIKGYKGKVNKSEEPTLEKNNIRFMTTHRIFSFWHYKGLKSKIKTSENATKETLLMQMIDELSKVPDVIYQNVPKDVQDSFIENWNEYYKDNEENQENLENSKVVHPVIRKRYEDKFNYFAIRFLDEYVDFPTLRFQVHLGNYLEDSRAKKIGNVFTEREIKKKLFVFGKLNEINQLKSDFFQEIKEKKEETQWEIFPNPSYHFPMENSEELKAANKIGIYIDHEKSINKYKHQAKKLSSDAKKNLIEEIIGSKSKMAIGQPIAYLSMNDIHSIIFEALEKLTIEEGKINGKAIEEKIKRQINKQIDEIINRDEKAKIIKNHSKKEVTDFNIEKLIDDVKKEIEITCNLEKKLTEKENKYKAYQKIKGSRNVKTEKRNHVLYNSEKGEIATWLANDIKRFFPKEFKESWKGYQHNEFQLNLAYYDTQKQSVELLLIGLNYQKEIPMIYFSKISFLEFYEEYLKKRKKYFTNLLADLEKHKKGEPINKDKLLTKCFTVFKKKNYQNKALDEKIKTTLASPIFIERGFLDSKPTVIAGKKFYENKNEFADWFVAFKKFCDYQKFYDITEYPLDTKQKTKTEINKIHTKIYTQKKNDWAAWKMVHFIFKDIFKQGLQNVALSELYQSRAERIKNKEEKKQNFIWNRTIDLQLNEKIQIPKVKLKDIGNFRKHEKDQRVKTFLSYGDITGWMAYLPNDWNENHTEKPINVIDIQIDEYEKIRQHELLKEVQTLEKEIYSNVTDKGALLNEIEQKDKTVKKNPNFKKYIVNGLLKQIKKMNVDNFKITQDGFKFNNLTKDILNSYTELEQKTTLLVLIRNKFAHNQLPNNEVYEFSQNLLKREENQTYAAYYLEIFKKLKTELQ
ncbi:MULTISPECIES: type VI-B CRISPR-associated RNA-guided ribonuclease Cas13b [Chryseobacterium]|uniref:Uncharacterized protein n=1 Tax=Chryseobacterium taihuense TaxID=1141221 RepID=A0A4U8WDU3_9FLAO|nr:MULTISPECIES: type VI-B CRISPR-associated RNA-guided ribonuclease Cas13b [Chryseobacterium]QQV03602.1 type VI-B CRISPR-associated RNA-guided ribonuclease Cas13b [Chryseobacterium sp. FDAARGOS 1104]VFB03065.1 Uncharacterised protein [Chryseobacterium taihuense]